MWHPRVGLNRCGVVMHPAQHPCMHGGRLCLSLNLKLKPLESTGLRMASTMFCPMPRWFQARRPIKDVKMYTALEWSSWFSLEGSTKASNPDCSLPTPSYRNLGQGMLALRAFRSLTTARASLNALAFHWFASVQGVWSLVSRPCPKVGAASDHLGFMQELPITLCYSDTAV